MWGWIQNYYILLYYIYIHILGNTHPLATYFRVHIPVLEFWPKIMFDDVWWTIRVARLRAPWRLARTRAPEPTLGRHLVSWKACEAARRVSWVMIWDDMSRDFLLPSKHVDRKQQAREPAETNLQNCGPVTTPQTWARQELGWHGDTSNKQALQDIINGEWVQPATRWEMSRILALELQQEIDRKGLFEGSSMLFGGGKHKCHASCSYHFDVETSEVDDIAPELCPKWSVENRRRKLQTPNRVASKARVQLHQPSLHRKSHQGAKRHLGSVLAQPGFQGSFHRCCSYAALLFPSEITWGFHLLCGPVTPTNSDLQICRKGYVTDVTVCQKQSKVKSRKTSRLAAPGWIRVQQHPSTLILEQ